MVRDGTSCSAEEAHPPGDHARTSHLQSMSDTGRIRSMGPVSLLRVKSAAVTWVLTSQWAIEIARGPEEIGPLWLTALRWRTLSRKVFADVVVLHKRQQQIEEKLEATALRTKRVRRRLCSKLNRAKVATSLAIRRIPFRPDPVVSSLETLGRPQFMALSQRSRWTASFRPQGYSAGGQTDSASGPSH